MTQRSLSVLWVYTWVCSLHHSVFTFITGGNFFYFFFTPLWFTWKGPPVFHYNSYRDDCIVLIYAAQLRLHPGSFHLSIFFSLTFINSVLDHSAALVLNKLWPRQDHRPALNRTDCKPLSHCNMLPSQWFSSCLRFVLMLRNGWSTCVFSCRATCCWLVGKKSLFVSYLLASNILHSTREMGLSMPRWKAN